MGTTCLDWRQAVINKPIKIVGNRWYYSDDVYINVRAGYYELNGRHGYIRSFNNMYDAIAGALFQVRFSS
nr:MAG TPA: hypothetical protein [Caudoviricetes sp.]